MAESPIAFLRGAAAVMAGDIGLLPSPSIRVQACGDCHLMNFGVYATAEGAPIFDINDFDETQPAPFEWDVKRLTTCIVLAGRHAELGDKAYRQAARIAARTYRQHLGGIGRSRPLADLAQPDRRPQSPSCRTKRLSNPLTAPLASASVADIIKREYCGGQGKTRGIGLLS
jgi:uncharacterized protein (DUF2252 family)